MSCNSKTIKSALIAMVAVVSVLWPSAAPAQTAASVLQKTREAYLALKSYADTGVVRYAQFPEQHKFATYFIRSPRHFLLQFYKQSGDQYVIWGDPGAFHTWWKTTGQQSDFPNPNNIPAISLSEVQTQYTAVKIPTLLYGKSPLAAKLLAFADPVLDGTEDVGGHRCYRITGRASDTYVQTHHEVNIHRTTVWIDADSYLIRQVQEEWKATPGTVNRTTTSYEPQANPNLDESRFKFVPPQS